MKNKIRVVEIWIANWLPQIIKYVEWGGVYIQSAHGYQKGFVVPFNKPCTCITSRTMLAGQNYLILMEPHD